MEYTSEFDETKGVCMVRVTGRHERPRDSLTLQQFARDFGKVRGCQLFLFDMTQAEITGGSAAMVGAAGVSLDSDHTQHQQKGAVVYASNMDDNMLMASAAGRWGYQVHVFKEVEKATKWLRPKESNA